VSRRVDLPGASELFRATSDKLDAAASGSEATAVTKPDAPPRVSGVAAPTGRVRHEEKITVYVSSEELVALERLRLDLRAEHAVAVDRGRIVRAAIAEALADVTENGAQSRLIRRLTQP
jgi:hypothetical protein